MRQGVLRVSLAIEMSLHIQVLFCSTHVQSDDGGFDNSPNSSKRELHWRRPTINQQVRTLFVHVRFPVRQVL